MGNGLEGLEGWDRVVHMSWVFVFVAVLLTVPLVWAVRAAGKRRQWSQRERQRASIMALLIGAGLYAATMRFAWVTLESRMGTLEVSSPDRRYLAECRCGHEVAFWSGGRTYLHYRIIEADSGRILRERDIPTDRWPPSYWSNREPKVVWSSDSKSVKFKAWWETSYEEVLR